MKPNFKMIGISTVSAVVGGAVVFLALKGSPTLREKLENSDTTHPEDLTLFENNGAITHPFETLFPDHFGEGSFDNIITREDSEFVYYDIKVNDLNSTSVDTKIENGYITITGTIEKKNSNVDKEHDNGISSLSIFKSTFNRTFSLPAHVDHNKMEMIPEKDKIILKFPKVS